MLRLTDHPEWTKHADALAERVRSGDRIGVRIPVLRGRMIARVREAIPEAVHIFVPAGADQAERVFLALGTALGPEAVIEVDKHLRACPDSPEDLLEEFSRRLGSRPVLVDGWDAIGPVGVDRELGSALRTRTDAFRRWLDDRPGLFVSHSRTPRSAPRVDLPTESGPVSLANGAIQDTDDLWHDAAGDAGIYTLALTCRALGAPVDEEDLLSERGLRARILEMLPGSVAHALNRVAIHGRPLARTFLCDTVEPEGLRLGRDLGLWNFVDEDVVPEPGWTEFLHDLLPFEVRQRYHVGLAKAFLSDFRSEDVTAPVAGLSILEAHRHLVEARDFERARQYWRYGATLLIEAARDESIARRYGEAARLYGAVVDATDRREIAVPRRLRAYARHYLHFNRGHGELESFTATERGYRQALKEWPENALFWSRLVRVVCFQDRAGAALVDLAAAQGAVEHHWQKQTFLVARTVRGLLDRGRLLDAVRVWGDYGADTPYAREVQQRLYRALVRGWPIERLIFDPDEPLVFTRPVDLCVVQGGGRWSAELRGLSVFGDGVSPLTAIQALVAAVRTESGELVRSYTSDLGPSDRLRKRLLFGVVDVLASRVDAPAGECYWYFGTLFRDEAAVVWLRTGGERELWFEVPGELLTVVDDLPHLARIATDSQGVPAGPVLELRPGFRGSDEDLWDAWRLLLADAG